MNQQYPLQRASQQSHNYWIVTEDILGWLHVDRRIDLFVPTEEDNPIPFKYLGVLGATTADLDTPR